MEPLGTNEQPERQTMSVDIACVGFGPATAGFLADALHDHPKLRRLTFPGRPDHPQADLIRRQMSGGSTMLAISASSAIV